MPPRPLRESPAGVACVRPQEPELLFCSARGRHRERGRPALAAEGRRGRGRRSSCSAAEAALSGFGRAGGTRLSAVQAKRRGTLRTARTSRNARAESGASRWSARTVPHALVVARRARFTTGCGKSRTRTAARATRAEIVGERLEALGNVLCAASRRARLRRRTRRKGAEAAVGTTKADASDTPRERPVAEPRLHAAVLTPDGVVAERAAKREAKRSSPSSRGRDEQAAPRPGQSPTPGRAAGTCAGRGALEPRPYGCCRPGRSPPLPPLEPALPRDCDARSWQAGTMRPRTRVAPRRAPRAAARGLSPWRKFE